jgi:hypothetical protein
MKTDDGKATASLLPTLRRRRLFTALWCEDVDRGSEVSDGDAVVRISG